MASKLPAPLPILAAAAAGAGFAASRVLHPSSGATPAPTAPGAQAGGAGDSSLAGSTGGDIWSQFGGDSNAWGDSGTGGGTLPTPGALPPDQGGGGAAPIPAPAPASTPTQPTSTAAPYYNATVSVATALWSPGAQRWVYNGPNAIKAGTALVIRGAHYIEGGVSCYPIVGAAYTGYWVPVAHVRVGSRIN